MTPLIPDSEEYDEYYGRYISLVPDGDLFQLLEHQQEELTTLLTEKGMDRGSYRYAEGKWSLKEVLGHVIDTERVFAFRALAFSRGDRQPYPGMDQDDYADGAGYHERSLSSILDEYSSLRASTISLFRSFNDAMLLRSGTASGCLFSVRSIIFIVAGHERHHMKIIREKYLS